MSLQAARLNMTKPNTRRDQRRGQQTLTEENRPDRVAKIAATIVKALERPHNQGYIHAYGEENLLLILAYEIKFGDHMQSNQQREKSRQDFLEGRLDTQIKSSDMQRQINARQLIVDAVKLAVEQQMIYRVAPSADDMVALHLPLAKINPPRKITRADLPQSLQKSESPEWVVFLNKSEHPVSNHAYLPMRHSINHSDTTTALSEDQDYAPRNGREIHLLRLWGELAA